MVDYLQSGLLWLSTVLAANVVLLSSNRQKPLLPQSFYFHETYIFSCNEFNIFYSVHCNIIVTNYTNKMHTLLMF